jgi:hypothetical protein
MLVVQQLRRAVYTLWNSTRIRITLISREQIMMALLLTFLLMLLTLRFLIDLKTIQIANTTYTATLNTDTAVVFDGNGPFEDKRFSPEWLAHDLWDTTNNKIDLSDVPVGSLVLISYQIKIIPTSSNNQLMLFLRFGTFNDYEMTLFDGDMGRGQNTVHDYVGTKMFFVINEELQQNGIQIMVNATCDIEIQPAFLTIALL